MDAQDGMKYLTFFVYIVLWDVAILVGTFYATFILGHSGWWWLLAVFLMGTSFKPRHFGIEQKPKLED
jgi:hypothetical protein